MTPAKIISPSFSFFVGNKEKHSPNLQTLFSPLFSFFVAKNITPISLLTVLFSCFLFYWIQKERKPALNQSYLPVFCFIGNKRKQNLPYLHKPNLVLLNLKQSKIDLVQDHPFQHLSVHHYPFQYLSVQHYPVQYHSVQYCPSLCSSPRRPLLVSDFPFLPPSSCTTPSDH